MEIFEPSNFFDMAGVLANVFTGLVAVAGLLIALKTYVVAKEAKDEWKLQKDLDFYTRFSRILPVSKEYIERLRDPLSVSQEILPEYQEQFRNGDKIDHDRMRIYHQELVVFSRRKRYETEIQEYKKLLFESLMYLEDTDAIPKYLNFIIDTERKVISASKQLSFDLEALKDPDISKDYRDEIRTNRIQSRSLLYGLPGDPISKDMNKLYDECTIYLKSVRNKTKYNS